MKLKLYLLFALISCTAFAQQTFYVRQDGGTRYSATQPKGQCDGKADAPYVAGSGVNQHCAFGDYRYLYTDGTYGNSSWAIAGGDTVILRGGPWRVGYNGPLAANYFGNVPGDPYGSFNPPIPAGTAAQHTRILGENYASCNSGNQTQIFGGYGVLAALNLRGAQYVDVECVELTRHSQCTRFGVPASPPTCNSSYPLDDYATNGILTDVNTHDLLLQDVWVHGFTSRGIIGPIGGLVTCLRCDIAFNGGGGWDFDDGTAAHTPSVNATWKFISSSIGWNGCNQEYPIVHAIPASSCYGQSNGGYGDGVGSPAGSGMTVQVDGSTFVYNVQEGLDLLHNDTGTHTLSVTNSTFVGNGGAALKWGPNFQTAMVTGNVIQVNCKRMSAPITGAPAGFNANLGDFCRALDAVPFNFRNGGSTTFANNTVITYAPTTFDVSCSDATGCPNSTLNFNHNIVLAYNDPAATDYSGGGGPGVFYYGQPIGNVARSNNLYFGVGHSFCPGSLLPTEQCADPLFMSEPSGTGKTFVEAELDNFSGVLSTGSPAIAMGAGGSLFVSGDTFTTTPITSIPISPVTPAPKPFLTMSNGTPMTCSFGPGTDANGTAMIVMACTAPAPK